MKRCGRCLQTKRLDAFASKSSGRAGHQSYCRSCQHEYYLAYYRSAGSDFAEKLRARTMQQRTINVAYVHDFLSRHPCIDCGIGDPIVLEFDHVTGMKRDSISSMIYLPSSLTTLKAEIAKCVVRCANCHRRKTARRWKRARGTRREAGISR